MSETGKINSYVMPGEWIGNIKNYESGNGTYIDSNNDIISNCFGKTKLMKLSKNNSNNKKRIKLKGQLMVKHFKNDDIIPKVGDIIIGKIIKITSNHAITEIIYVNNNIITNNTCIGIIRKQDIRKIDIDNIQIYKCFRQNDIIKAKIISLGNLKNYYLSTVDSNFGVIIGYSIFGHKMIPISWNKMQCKQTKVIEMRKVAKIDSKNFKNKKSTTQKG